MEPVSTRPIDVESIRAALVGFGVEVPAGTAQLLANHLALVAKWNRAYNLTAVRDPGEMVARHVLDSAAALPYLRGTRMLDIGSGAGFPGLALAILVPQTEWVLAESAGKKARFLEHAVRRLGLGGRVAVHEGRVERYRPERGFDTVTARALAELSLLADWAAPLLAPGARLVALKGRRREIDAELAALGPGWRADVTAAAVSGESGERHIVVLEREADG